MTKDDINLKSIFEEAAKSVEGLPEILQAKAFEIAVEKLLSPTAPTSSSSNDNVPSPLEVVSKTTNGDFFEKISQEVSINETDVKIIYRIDKNNDLKIIASLEGGNADKQRQLAYLYLLARNIGFDQEWVSATEFAKLVEDYGANDGHISKSLKTEKGLILQSGKVKGKEYNLTPNGIAKAKGLIMSLLAK